MITRTREVAVKIIPVQLTCNLYSWPRLGHQSSRDRRCFEVLGSVSLSSFVVVRVKEHEEF